MKSASSRFFTLNLITIVMLGMGVQVQEDTRVISNEEQLYAEMLELVELKHEADQIRDELFDTPVGHKALEIHVKAKDQVEGVRAFIDGVQFAI